jgi:outer membrane immunogenic protein
MKKVVIVACAFGALTFPAAAADMPLKAPPPPPAPVASWTGCYLGGNFGGIWKQNDPINVTFVDGGSGAAAAVAAGALPTSFNPNASSWIGGGQLGCNYQASNWVVGLETDIAVTRLNADQTISTNVAPFFPPLTTSATQDLSWIGTTRGRLGFLWGNWLVYGTGGLAYANVNYTYTQNNTAGGGPVALFAQDSTTQFGWTAGGGLEVLLGAWSVKGEYLYYDVGSHALTAVCQPIIAGGACTGLSPTSFTANYQNRGSIARIGFNYHFH